MEGGVIEGRKSVKRSCATTGFQLWRGRARDLLGRVMHCGGGGGAKRRTMSTAGARMLGMRGTLERDGRWSFPLESSGRPVHARCPIR
jgi:hypothetical protein